MNFFMALVFKIFSCFVRWFRSRLVVSFYLVSDFLQKKQELNSASNEVSHPKPLFMAAQASRAITMVCLAKYLMFSSVLCVKYKWLRALSRHFSQARSSLLTNMDVLCSLSFFIHLSPEVSKLKPMLHFAA